MQFREYIQKHRVLVDGAMGTYYGSKYEGKMAEKGNVKAPQRVLDIHLAYIKAGANLIFTNTFSANEWSLGQDCQAVD